MAKPKIPSPDLKFTKTTDKKICPKCGSTDVFDTGYRSDNIQKTLNDFNKIPKHPVYRCSTCAQLFRLTKPEKK